MITNPHSTLCVNYVNNYSSYNIGEEHPLINISGFYIRQALCMYSYPGSLAITIAKMSVNVFIKLVKVKLHGY